MANQPRTPLQALVTMVEVFSVKSPDPLIAFVAIEQARGAIESATIEMPGNLVDAARAIIRARDHMAEHGNYDPTDFAPGTDQSFDDWAADILETALGA